MILLNRWHRWLNSLPSVLPYLVVISVCVAVNWACYPVLPLLKDIWWDPVANSHMGREIGLVALIAALPSLLVVGLILASLFWFPFILLPREKAGGIAGTLVATVFLALFIPALIWGY